MKASTPFSPQKRQETPNILEQNDAPWGLQRISNPDPIPQEIRPDSTKPVFKYQYDSLSGQGVDVYIVDGGVNTTHPEFGDRAKILFSDFGDDGMDSAANKGHGTMVAGVIGSSKFGVAKNVNIWGLKCEMGNGDRTSRCLNQILLNHQSRQDLPEFKGSVINMSFGSYRPHRSELERSNLTALVQAGVHIVTSAGNDNKDACGHWPSVANQDDETRSVISVGASNISDKKAFFSNNGTCVDIYAPGWALTTTMKGGSVQASGTSFAAPAVAGVVAVELALNSQFKLDPAGMKEYIISKGVELDGVGILVNTRMSSMQ
ncbi:Cerevisin [Dactylellina cionopaga]|nr:Cerevisin [Dactylellina cionopaga]